MEQRHITWNINFTDTPKLIKRCPKCGGTRYYNSGFFRVNANGKRLDVWLIYRCEHCDATWNLPIYERAPRNSIDNTLYKQFLANDADLARQYGLDKVFLDRCCAKVDVESTSYDISGDIAQGTVTLRTHGSIGIPLSRIIAQKLDISTSALKRAIERGDICTEHDIKKTHLQDGLNFTILRLPYEPPKFTPLTFEAACADK